MQKLSDTQSWELTLEKAIKAIVSIKANHVRTFDTEPSGAYSATGFVVDKVRGIILSNRHVVSPGPIVAQAIFRDYEEVELKPIYRDPVHDFGFFKFDPSKVKFMDLEQIPLCPEKAKIGIEIRIAGNDNGEVLSILSGTLARLDRRAPEYGVGGYNDFNTFYYQAASGTSGGSSGSPVIDIEGNAVALNAGGETIASSSFYLPLDRVKRTLKYLQEGTQVPRGTLQTEFEYTPYDELRHLGLKSSIEKEIREKFPNDTGLLVVRIVLPKGPADGLLVPGDIVIRANKKIITNFTHLFSIIDDSVGEIIELTICRGKTQMDVQLKIQDLHSITPNRFVEVSGEVINELSYQLAHSYSQPVGGPYIATSGYMLSSINNIPTPNLDAFIDVVKQIPDGTKVPLKVYHLYNIHKEIVEITQLDRHWNKFRVATRDDTTGLWNYEDMPPPVSIKTYKPVTAQFQAFNEPVQPIVGKIWPSFVMINFYLPFNVDGIKSAEPYGAGLIVSTEPPLIICDRYTVPTSIGDIFITFANSIMIPGKLVYQHPIYNCSFLTYDKTLLEETSIEAIELSDKNLEQGDSVNFIGIYENYLPTIKKTTVISITDVITKKCNPPRWRAMNVDEIRVDNPTESLGGVLCDGDGKVQGLWLTYSYQNDNCEEITYMKGFPISLIKPTLKSLKDGETPILHGLDVEFRTMRIVEAKNYGLSDEWVKKIESIKNSNHTLLHIINILDSTSPAGKLLKVGDIILMINGNIITKMSDLPAAIHYSKEVEILILRDREEKEYKVETIPYYGKETTRVVGWSGAVIQEPYKAVLEQVRNVPTGVYVSHTLCGSPAYVSITPGVWIIEIQERKVSDLDSCLEAIHAFEKELVDDDDDGYVRIKIINNNDVTDVVTMKLDPHYWNTWQLIEDKETLTGWKYVNTTTTTTTTTTTIDV
ncbi:trypsin-like cysteine/serine peptidase domain-containing protein [Glomus cerebriforme]|uniref:Trypsin-like cysteine/serine peptidase domain-containing protein n=1 Tax=Glomus cerebriforme TaxID=658196 RepID=A0A397SYV5_9GLOM|nr:trypsin-like cysteine/serine peptidase domain-containing protein [Glomus cerebriforme]